MSRIELHCPSCGYDVPMTLLPPPKEFTCPGCNETMPRNKLTRLKVLHRNIAGATPAISLINAASGGTNKFFDPTQATATLAVANVVIPSGGATLIVWVVDVLATGGTGGPAGVSVSGTTAMTEVTVSQQGDISLTAFQKGNVAAGTRTITANTWAANPTAAAMFVTVLTGAQVASLPVDQFAISGGHSTSPNSSAVPPLLVAGEIAIAAVGSQDTGLVSAAAYSGGFVSGQFAGTSSGGPPADVNISEGRLSPVGPGAVTAAATIPNSVDWICGVVTVQPR